MPRARHWSAQNDAHCLRMLGDGVIDVDGRQLDRPRAGDAGQRVEEHHRVLSARQRHRDPRAGCDECVERKRDGALDRGAIAARLSRC